MSTTYPEHAKTPPRHFRTAIRRALIEEVGIVPGATLCRHSFDAVIGMVTGIDRKSRRRRGSG
ncbi:hypothetical protein GCM10023178_76340 [Actinomadura luteofluorescens]